MDLTKVTVVLCGILSVAGSVCLDGWVRHGGSCYHFSHDKEDWLGALELCRLIGGTLLEINDAVENNFIMGQAVSRGNPQYFIALTDVVEENVWVWMVSNSKLTNTSYTNWSKGQPNNLGGIENCACIKSDGEWFDDECFNNHLYICEKADAAVDIIG